MSSSNKKQISGSAEKLTERQLAEQKEAQQLKVYTGLFVGALALIIVLAVFMGVSKSLTAKAERDRVKAETDARINTIVATTGGHEINAVEMNYFYTEYVNNMSNTYQNYYGDYAYLFMGFDTSVSLDEQYYDEASGKTWSDYFLDCALSQAESVYALCDAAEKEGYTLSAEEQSSLNTQLNNVDSYAALYGVSADTLLEANYGIGATKDSYADFCTRRQLASSYQSHYQASIENTPEEISERDAASPEEFSNYSYNQYYLAVSKFLTGGTTSEEDGTVTYSEEERAAAALSAEEAVNALAECTTVENLDIAISGLSFNVDTTAASTACTNYAYSSINSVVSEWVTDPARQPGDCTALPVKTTTDDVEEVTAYYIVLFNGVETNETEMINVRHILISYSGDQEEDGSYSEAAHETAKAEAERILNEWKASENANEDSFAALAGEYSTDTGSSSNGGLYENVYPGQMVATFNDWCFDANRQPGDTGIVETDYGYHVMYFVGTTGQTYRDYQISELLLDEKMDSWFEGITSGIESTLLDTSLVNTADPLNKVA